MAWIAFPRIARSLRRLAPAHLIPWLLVAAIGCSNSGARDVRACSPGCADGSVCEADAGVCVACLRDTDCGDPARPRCDVTTHACVVCTADADCPLGKVCKAGACLDGCSAQHGCAANESCC